MLSRALIGWAILSLGLLPVPVWAVEYRLQVTNVDDRIFSSYLERSHASPSGQETMQRLETRLDTMEFPPAAVIPGREVRLLEDPAYGGKIPARVSLLPATGQQPWTTYVWEGTPGERVAFVVRSYMAAWQEVWDVAANPNGTLRRLTFGGPALFGGQSREVPAVPRDFLATAADHGTFVSWLQRHTKPVGGMAFVVGRRHEQFTSVDRVYMLITPPPAPHTFKVVIGWKDHDDRSDDLDHERTLWRP